MIKRGKRAVSPVVSTILLIGIVFVLAAIIFLWARGFIKEEVEKFGEPATRSCDKIDFNVEINGNNVFVTNRGNVPIYKFAVNEFREGRSDIVYSEPINLDIGESGNFSETFGSDISKIIVTPVVLGKTKNLIKEYVCGEEMGKIIELA